MVDAPMVKHCMDAGHCPEDLKFVVLQIVSAAPDSGTDIHKKLLQQEAFWTFRLQSVYPDGLNTHLDLSVFL